MIKVLSSNNEVVVEKINRGKVYTTCAGGYDGRAGNYATCAALWNTLNNGQINIIQCRGLHLQEPLKLLDFRCVRKRTGASFYLRHINQSEEF